MSGSSPGPGPVPPSVAQLLPFAQPGRPETLDAAPPGSREDRLARVALAQLGEPGDLRIASLVHQLGASVVADGLLAERDPGNGMLADVAGRLAAIDPARDLDRAHRMGIRHLVPGDPEWPRQVDDLLHAEPLQSRGGAPLGLWVRGPRRLDSVTSSVAVVGSRSASSYGEQVALEIGAALAQAGWTTVSGAAFGIDQAAHRGALSIAGPTVAVLAGGVDRAYPKAHQNLLDHIAAEHAVVSELPPGAAPTRLRFLARNRLIAALARGTVVVEAASRSGALNTANWTTRLHRPLMGVPGAVTSAQSEGVHDQIRIGAAGLVTCGAHVLEVVGASGEHLVAPPRGRVVARDAISGRHAQVLDAVPVSEEARVDSIARAAGVGLLEVTAALTHLQKAGLVHRGDRGWRLTADAHR